MTYIKKILSSIQDAKTFLQNLTIISKIWGFFQSMCKKVASRFKTDNSSEQTPEQSSTLASASAADPTSKDNTSQRDLNNLRKHLAACQNGI